MLNKQQIEKAMRLLCSPEEAARVGYRVVGLRAALLSYTFASHFVLKDREAARIALGLSAEHWEKFGAATLEYWQESEMSGQLMLVPPKEARKPRFSKGQDIFSPTSYGNALPLAAPVGPTKVAELPGESAARALEEMFDAFWAAYPKKSNKKTAYDSFKRLHATPDDIKAILHDLSLRAFTKQWLDGEGMYIQNPATYLNNRVWEQPFALSELELAASVLPLKDRQAIFSKPKREIESWIGSQKVLGRIPSQAQLQARLGASPESHGRGDDLEVIDVEFHESGATPGGSGGIVQGGSVPALVRKPELVDPFEVEFMQAVNTVADPEKRERIMGRDATAKRAWLNSWKTMRASGSGTAAQSAPAASTGRPWADSHTVTAAPPRQAQVAVQEPCDAQPVEVMASGRTAHNMFERRVWM